MTFILTPDYFLLFVLVGGFLIVIMTAMVYALQCTRCLRRNGSKRRKKLSPSSSSLESSQPPGLGQSQLSYPGAGVGGGGGRPVIGTGFYTSPPIFSVNIPCGTDLVDQAFGQPEWMSGYLFGLNQAALVQSGEDGTNDGLNNNNVEGASGHNNNHSSQNIFYAMTNSNHNTSTLNIVDPWVTHDSASFIGSDHCYSSSSVDESSATTSTMDFCDGGGDAAAAF